MAKPKKDPVREERIDNDVVVDAYGPEERAMGWYYYLENKIRFPFRAKCITAKLVSPLRKGGDGRRPTPRTRRILLWRHAGADPLARPKRGRSLVATDRH